MTRAPLAGADLYGWMALRRAHRGGVAKLASHWLDSGRPVPGYVADALDGLTSAGLLALGEADPQSCGVRRVTVTDTGSARYVALCQVHNPTGRAAVGTPCRWACSPYDQRSHLLAKRGPDQMGIVVAVCGHRMPWSADTSAQSTGRRCLTCQSLAGVTVPPVPRFGHSPDSGRPPVEQPPRLIPAPGGRPDTTAPDPITVIFQCVQLAIAGVEVPVIGPNVELLGTLVLKRAFGDGVVKLGGDYLNDDLPTPGGLAAAFGALTDAGLLALANPEPPGLRWITLTAAGRAGYTQLLSARETSRCPGVRVPDPQFPHKTPAGRRSSAPIPLPAPGGQPESNPETRGSGLRQLRWTRCLHDGRLHLLEPADVAAATTGGHAQALCGHSLPAESLTIANCSPGALGMACVAGIVPGKKNSPPRWAPPGQDRADMQAENIPPHRAAGRRSASPEVTHTMPTRPPRPVYDPWCDADGTPIPQHCRIEQIAVHKEHGALPSRLHKQGQVISRGISRLTVRFDDNTVIRIRPHLVRVLTTPDGC